MEADNEEMKDTMIRSGAIEINGSPIPRGKAILAQTQNEIRTPKQKHLKFNLEVGSSVIDEDD